MNRYEVNGEKKNTYDIMVDSIEFLENKDDNSSGGSYKVEQPTPSSTEEYVDDDFPF